MAWPWISAGNFPPVIILPPQNSNWSRPPENAGEEISNIFIFGQSFTTYLWESAKTNSDGEVSFDSAPRTWIYTRGDDLVLYEAAILLNELCLGILVSLKNNLIYGLNVFSFCSEWKRKKLWKFELPSPPCWNSRQNMRRTWSRDVTADLIPSLSLLLGKLWKSKLAAALSTT